MVSDKYYRGQMERALGIERRRGLELCHNVDFVAYRKTLVLLEYRIQSVICFNLNKSYPLLHQMLNFFSR